MRGEQNLQDTIRDGKNSWSLKQRGDMRVEGKKFSVGGIWRGRKIFKFLRGGIWRGRKKIWAS